MTDPFELSITDSPATADVDRLRAGLKEHSRSFVDSDGFQTLAVFARDPSDNEKIVGGAFGFVNWNWFDLSLLWVAADLRSQGLGSKLLRAIEAEAMDRGCRRAHVETFSYQALEFYRRHGFEVFAELDDYPPSQTKSFLKKRLTA